MFYSVLMEKSAKRKDKERDQRGLSRMQMAGVGAGGLLSGGAMITARDLDRDYGGDALYKRLFLDTQEGFADLFNERQEEFSKYYEDQMNRKDVLSKQMDRMPDTFTRDGDVIDNPHYLDLKQELDAIDADVRQQTYLRNEKLLEDADEYIKRGKRRFYGTVGLGAGLGALGTAGLMRMYNNRNNSEE